MKAPYLVYFGYLSLAGNLVHSAVLIASLYQICLAIISSRQI
jgi:hypothetical protein